MHDEINDWLEQEYREFEGQAFAKGKVWRSPVHTLKGTHLYSLFESFAGTFPDHPSESNTVFYLTEFYLTESADTTHRRQQVWLWCSHFEHAALEDLRNLVFFMDEAVRVLSTSDDLAWVEVLDNSRERVVLVFHDPQESAVELLKSRGVRVDAR